MRPSSLVLLVLICETNSLHFREDVNLDFKGIAEKYGQRAEVFRVVTADGYILKLDHIVGVPGKPVLFVHGMLDSSDGCIIRGNISLAVNLARSGYDVWALNLRGNRYTRTHTTLDPNKDPAFWDFYVHEYGTEDLPAVIDFIIDKTQSNLSIIGNSEGFTTTLVLGAVKPEYNDKVNIFIGTAPVCFLEHAQSPVATALKLGPHFNRGLRRSRTEEVFGYYSPIRTIIDTFCSDTALGYGTCVQLGVFPFTGFNPSQYEPEFLPVWLAHYPAGCSRKNIYHLAQIANRKKFAHDYGIKKNLVKYGSKEPSEYNLTKVTMKVALLTAINDPIATMEDVNLLRQKLQNVVEFRVMEDPSFNHIDFNWGRVTYTIVLPHVLDILSKYA